MTITLEVPAEMEGPLQKAARTRGTDVATFLLESVRQRLRPDVLSEAETKLLMTINAPLAPEARSERDALLAQQTQRELSNDEQATLANKIDAVEMANAARWQALAELARLRGLSLTEIARELGLPLP